MPNPYTKADFKLVDSYYRIHANAEQTHVVIFKAGDRDFVAVAYDVYPTDYEPIQAEIIGHDPTLEGVSERANRWMQEHPKGIAYEEEKSGSRFLRILKKLGAAADSYGKDLIEQNKEKSQ